MTFKELSYLFKPVFNYIVGTTNDVGRTVQYELNTEENRPEFRIVNSFPCSDLSSLTILP